MERFLRLVYILSLATILFSLASYDVLSEVTSTHCFIISEWSDTDGDPQTCDKPFLLEVETGSLLQIQYYVAGSPEAVGCSGRHCSSVRVHIYVDGAFMQTTDWLGWPGGPSTLSLDTGLLDVSPVSPGTHELSLKAEGQVGGCNGGRLISWGGKLIVYTSSQLADLRAIEYCYGDPSPGYQWLENTFIFESWLHVLIENMGDGHAYNVTATVVDQPANVTVVDGDVTIGDISSGDSAWSVDTFKLQVDMSNPQDPNEGIFWRIEYDDSEGVHHIIDNVPQFP